MKKTIMVVDDSAVMRQAVAFTLRNAGYDILEAVDGADALNKLSGQKVNLIVCDLNMPRMDGIGLLTAVRAMPEFRFIPVIMLTTESQEVKMTAGKLAGAKAWMIKPFKPERIVETVSKLCLPVLGVLNRKESL
ncbi:MAG: response regulator [Deltaproteobacteria bacterium]|nr:response regulator [Deltaproteobacteria bacterium]